MVLPSHWVLEVYVPKELTEIEIDQNVEVIYSYAFSGSSNLSLHFPKSLKNINLSMNMSKMKTITFEEGTELNEIRENFPPWTSLEATRFPLIKGKLSSTMRFCCKEIILPSNFNPEYIDSGFFGFIEVVVCSMPSIWSLKSTYIDERFIFIQG